MKLTFYGAAQCVTGSCHMLSTKAGNILIDCGLKQGEDADGGYGNESFAFDPKDVNVVLATHAHIDHIGLMPLLVKRGFAGPILATDATAQLATIMLPDSAHIQEQDAEWQTRKNLRAGKEAVEPLYTVKDAEAALKSFHSVPYGKRVELLPGVTCEFMDVGHLLGSAAIRITVTEDEKTTSIVFSGDLGRSDRPILRDPVFCEQADYLVMESTYGDRDHTLSESGMKEEELASVIRGALERGGNLVIPSFAVGRTQELLYIIKKLILSGRVPGLERMPVYIDSPLAIQATKVYERCAENCYDEEARRFAVDGSPFDFPTLHIAQTADESKLINFDKTPKIIISASGMCDAGRIRHHLKHNLYRADATVMFAGYQANGTLGRALTDGAKKVKLFGESVTVNANIVTTDGFSGHAGKSELIEWIQGIPEKPTHIFLVHGEQKAQTSLKTALNALGYEVSIPALMDEAELDGIAREEASTIDTDATAVPLATTAAIYESEEQLKRIHSILLRSEQRRSPDIELKRMILEADLRALADKWDQIIL